LAAREIMAIEGPTGRTQVASNLQNPLPAMMSAALRFGLRRDFHIITI
jgi:hypothetical protein